jgi:glycosyltransferase involved in cell wall biosynthesis
MPRVLLTGFCAVPGPRRAGVQLRHVIRALTPSCSVDLLVVREGDQGYVERQGSVRVLRVPAPETDLKAQIQSFQRALRRQLEGADYDVVHCRDSWSGLTVLEARERLGFAVVYDLTRAPIGESALDPELDAQYARDEEACILAADLVLAPTQAAVKALQNRGKPDRVMIAPPGVDVDRFDWDEATRSGPPKILYAGSIDAGRGVRVMIRAMAAIVREVDARLILAGPMVSPRFEAALKDGIRELGLTDKVELVGVVDHDEIPALLATASVCVVPAASDLTPNPTVVFPTKLLEYMACKRPIVAPRRETVQLVVENAREALLFEPGDPIDLARKVLRVLGEPILAQRIAQAGYDRVRKDFTASAARRALRNAYTVIADRFGQLDDGVEDSPKVEMLTDDDFEATVFEEAPISVPAVDTALNRIGDPHALEDALAQLDNGTASSSERLAPPPPPDDTLDRQPVAPARADTQAWTVSALVSPPAAAALGATASFAAPVLPDDWVVTNVAGAVRAISIPPPPPRALPDGNVELIDDVDTGSVASRKDHDDGTPVEGNAQVMSVPLTPGDGLFVAGEIDVPTPPPEKRTTEPQSVVDAEEFIAASSLLGNAEASDPDTGSRTPPLERRNP